MGLLSGGSGSVGAERELLPVRFENGRRRRRARALPSVGGETNPTAAATRGALVCGMSAGGPPRGRPTGAPTRRASPTRRTSLGRLRRMRARALPPLARRTHLVRVSDGRRGAASLCSGRARRIHPLRANLHRKPVSPHLCRHVLAHVCTCKSPGFLCKL